MKKAFFSYCAMILAAVLAALYPHLFSIKGCELDYMVVIYIIVFPAISFICTAVAATHTLLSALLGILIGALCAALMPLAVFGATGTVYLLFPVALSASGAGVGLYIGKLRRRKAALSSAQIKPNNLQGENKASEV